MTPMISKYCLLPTALAITRLPGALILAVVQPDASVVVVVLAQGIGEMRDRSTNR